MTDYVVTMPLQIYNPMRVHTCRLEIENARFKPTGLRQMVMNLMYGFSIGVEHKQNECSIVTAESC